MVVKDTAFASSVFYDIHGRTSKLFCISGRIERRGLLRRRFSLYRSRLAADCRLDTLQRTIRRFCVRARIATPDVPRDSRVTHASSVVFWRGGQARLSYEEQTGDVDAEMRNFLAPRRHRRHHHPTLRSAVSMRNARAPFSLPPENRNRTRTSRSQTDYKRELAGKRESSRIE